MSPSARAKLLGVAWWTAVLFFLFGCGPARRASPVPEVPLSDDLSSLTPDWPSGAVPLSSSSGAVWVSPVVSADARRSWLVLDAIEQAGTAWTAHFGRPVPPTRLVVLDAPFGLWDGSRGRYGYWPGIARPEFRDVVLVWAGDLNDVPWLFHELVHRVLGLTHHSPIDEPWWLEWDSLDGALDGRLRVR